MKGYSLVDTNVLISANGRDTHADLECQLKCIGTLEKIKSNKIVLLDNLGLILDEYSHHCNYKGEPGVGDYFFKYVHDNQLVKNNCIIIEITRDSQDQNNFNEFPKGPNLASFDFSDRKFVAVSIASNAYSPIYNATDSDWEEHKKELENNTITVIQLCPQHASK
jgi:hypothetical protein